MTYSPTPRRSVLVLPAHAVNPRIGGGQRSALFFSALKRMGPTEVVILGERIGPRLEELLPGHGGFHFIQTGRFPAQQRRGLRLLWANLVRFSLVAREYRPDPQVRAALGALLGPQHDLVVFRYISPFAIAGLEKTDPGTPPLFVDIDDRDDQKFLSAARQMFRFPPFLWLFETFVAPRLSRVVEAKINAASFVWLAAEEDRAAITGVPAGVVPNVPFFEVPETVPPASASRELLFVGTFAHRPNQDGMRWFLRECWPALHARHPDAVLRLVGMGDWASLRAEFPDLAGVEYVGKVDEIAPEYLRARLVVSPIFQGGGSKIKVIEACAFSRPVVATPHCLRGFGADLAETVPQAETAEAFVARCDRLLQDDAAVDALAGTLRRLQQARFSREAAEARIVADIEAALAGA